MNLRRLQHGKVIVPLLQYVLDPLNAFIAHVELPVHLLAAVNVSMAVVWFTLLAAVKTWRVYQLFHPVWVLGL